MNVDKLKLANWVGEVMDEIVKFASHNKTFWLGERVLHLQKTQKKTFKNHETFSKNHISRQKSQNHPPLLDLTRHVIIRHYDVKLSLYRKALFLPGYLKISRAHYLDPQPLH